jgi:transposase
VYQDYGYAKRGKKLYGSRTGKRTTRENLVAARRGRELLAPMLLKGSVNARGFEKWLEQWLCQELQPNSTLIMDNAPIHRKNKIEEIAEAKGHQVLFLPRYSPDFNSIEHDFAAMKKKRKYAADGTNVEQIVKEYSERDNSSILI